MKYNEIAIILFKSEYKCERVVAVDERKDDVLEMTNEEYRVELAKLFDSVDDNRILRYFYIFVSEKLKRVL